MRVTVIFPPFIRAARVTHYQFRVIVMMSWIMANNK